jgi:hypothetical protein
MCGRAGKLQVVVALSALATELATGTGSTRTVPWERADVMSFGVPTSIAASLYSPEGAALYAFTNSGKRVNSVPQLIMTPRPYSPVLVRWHLELEGQVDVVGEHSGVSRQRGSVWVGFGDVFKSSGLLDRDPMAGPPTLSGIDAVTKAPFTVVLTPQAPDAVEVVTRRNP